MRIVAGRHRGRRLESPPDQAVRPTAARTREALFSILEGGRLGPPEGLAGLRVLDAFAGSGALGLEALSRGAGEVVFLEKDPRARRLLAANITRLKEEARCRVIAGDALRPPPADAPCRLLLLDPPYGLALGGKALAALDAAGWIAGGAVVALEIAALEEPVPAVPGLAVRQARRYGRAQLIFLSKDEP